MVKYSVPDQQLLSPVNEVRNKNFDPFILFFHTYEWIDDGMTFHIMSLDVFKIGRFSKGGHIPIQMAKPLVNVRISITNITNIAFEVQILSDERISVSNKTMRCIKTTILSLT